MATRSIPLALIAVASLVAPAGAAAAEAWTGELRATTTGTYTLRTAATSDVRVLINGRLAVDSRAGRTWSRTLSLRAGRTYPVRVLTSARPEAAARTLHWRRMPSQGAAFTPIPRRLLVAKAPSRKPRVVQPAPITEPAPVDPVVSPEPTPPAPAPTPTPTPTPVPGVPAETLLAPTAAAANVGPRATAPCTGVSILPGASIQQAIDSSPTGTVFCLRAGTHRIAGPIVPRSGTSLLGEPGTVLSGARRLEGFTRVQQGWMLGGQTIESPATGWCEINGDTSCKLNEDVYVNDVRLTPVTSLAALATGTFYFDRAADRVYLSDDPTGRVVEMATAFRAFNGAGPATVRGLIVEKFANPAQTGAFHIQGAWTITDNVVRFNHGIGICGASGATVSHNLVTRNGQMGLCGTGAIGGIFERNEVSYNNTAGFKKDWEAGGAKWVATRGLIVRENFVHDNAGPGLWTDIDNVDSLIERNFVRSNDGPGIFHEISYAATIRHNAVLDNGVGDTCPTLGWCSTGIRISESSNVLVYGNVVRGEHGSILGIQAARGSGALGAYELRDVTIRDNDVSPGKGRVGVMQNVGDPSIFTARRIVFANNYYRLSCNATPFAWAGAYHGFVAWQQLGQDSASSATCV